MTDGRAPGAPLLDVAGGSLTGPRQNNQDCWYADHHLMVVADGMGGRPGGEVAAHLALAVILAHRLHNPAETTPLSSAVAADELIRLSRLPPLTDMGTTVTVVELYATVDEAGTPPSAHIWWVGDSPGYLIRSNRIESLTSPHSVAGELVGKGNLGPDELYSHPTSSRLTRSLGDRGAPEVRQLPLLDGDILIAASDGLTGVLSPEAIRRIAGKHSASTIVEDLLNRVTEVGAVDNTTVTVARYHAPEVPSPNTTGVTVSE